MKNENFFILRSQCMQSLYIQMIKCLKVIPKNINLLNLIKRISAYLVNDNATKPAWTKFLLFILLKWMELMREFEEIWIFWICFFEKSLKERFLGLLWFNSHRFHWFLRKILILSPIYLNSLKAGGAKNLNSVFKVQSKEPKNL